MDQAIRAIMEEIRGIQGHDLILHSEELRTLWGVAQQLAATSPEDAFEVIAFVAPRADSLGSFGDKNMASIFGLAADLAWMLKKTDGIFSGKAGEYQQALRNHGMAGVYFEHEAELMTKEKSGHNKLWAVSCHFYKKARLSYEAAGDSGKASECHIKGNKLTRDNHPDRAERFRLWAMYLLWKWGEGPWNVAASAAVLVFVYAFGFWVFGIKPSGTRLENLGNSVYLSTISFTTVGFGDYSPDSPWSKVLAASEGVLGILFTGLFLVTFVKRHGR